MLSSERGGRGAVQARAVSHIFCPHLEQGEVCFFFFLGHEEKQTGPHVNKRMNFITIKVRNSVQSSRMQDRTQGCPLGPANIYIYSYSWKYMEKSRRGIGDEQCPGREALQSLFMPSKPNWWDKWVYTRKNFSVFLEVDLFV